MKRVIEKKKSHTLLATKHFYKHCRIIDFNKNELIKKLVQTIKIVFVKSETRKANGFH